MIRAASTKISVEKDIELFMNYIENMGWITYLFFTKSGTDYNIAKHFVHVRIETIETDYEDMEIATQPTDNIKKLILCGFYTWIFNLIDG